MIKIPTIALVAAAMLIASNAFAGDKACCAKNASHTGKAACASFDNLGLTAGTEIQDRSMAGGLHESWLHAGESGEIPRTGERHSYR